MGVGNPVAVARNIYPPAAARPLEANDSNARSVVSRDASQIGAAPLAQIPQSLFGELVEPACGYVRFKLPIPSCSIELSEPVTECCQVIWRKLAHRFFYYLNRAHSVRVACLSIQCNYSADDLSCLACIRSCFDESVTAFECL